MSFLAIDARAGFDTFPDFAAPSLLDDRIEPLAPTVGDESDVAAVLGLIAARDFDHALMKARAAVEAHPVSASAHEIFGVALAKKGQLIEAQAEFERAVAIRPEQATAITKLGDIYVTQGNLEKAKEQFVRALGIDGNQRHAHQRLGLICQSEGDSEGAAEHFEKGLIGAPLDYVGIKVNLGIIYNERKEYANTIELFERALAPENPDATAWLTLGSAYLGAGRPSDAKQAFERAEKLAPDSEMARLALAVSLRFGGQAAESLRLLDKFLEASPKSEAANFQKGMTLLALNRTAEATLFFEKAASVSAKPGEIRASAGAALLTGKQYPEAIRFYESAIRSGASSVRNYDGLATACQLNGKLEEAKRVLREAVTKFKSEAFPHYRLGSLLAYAQEYAAAQVSFDQALRIAPSDPVILKARSAVDLRLGKKDEAVRASRKIAEVLPNDAASHVYFAGVLEVCGQPEEAISEYEKALKLFPNHPVALNNLAGLLAAKGEKDRAFEFAARAAEAFPKSAACQDTYGWIAFQKGDLATARAALEKSVVVEPKNPTYRAHLGLILTKLGENRGALDQLRIALNSNSEFSGRDRAEKALSALEKSGGASPKKTLE